MNTLMLYGIPIVRNLILLVGGGGLLIGLSYYLFVVKMRRVWQVNIWEIKADGKLSLVGADKIVAKKINKGKQTIYQLKKRRKQVLPPPEEICDKTKGKEYVNYIRVREDYVPLNREINLNTDREGIINYVKDALNEIKSMGTREAEEKFIYAPVDTRVVGKLNLSTIDYDVDMMRINAIELRQKIYALREDFLTKYGVFIAAGGIIVLVIVALYFSYSFAGDTITQAMGQTEAVANSIQQIADQLTGI